MPSDAEWEKRARDLLVGRRITHVQYTPREAASHQMWDERGIELYLDDGTILFVQRDDEGNGPGALAYANPKKKIEHDVLPVLRC